MGRVCSVPSATSWFGATYSLTAVPMALGVPQDFQTMWVTSPVGSPPLKNSDGLTSPKPFPWEKMTASWPKVGSGAVLAVVVVLDVVVLLEVVVAADCPDEQAVRPRAQIMTSPNPTCRFVATKRRFIRATRP